METLGQDKLPALYSLAKGREILDLQEWQRSSHGMDFPMANYASKFSLILFLFALGIEVFSVELSFDLRASMYPFLCYGPETCTPRRCVANTQTLVDVLKTLMVGFFYLSKFKKRCVGLA